MYQRYRAKEPTPPVQMGKREAKAQTGKCEAQAQPKPTPISRGKPLPSLLSGFDSGDALVLLILLLLLMEGNKESSSVVLTLVIFLLLR